MLGKRPAARDEAHGMLVARCGTGDATEEVVEAKREGGEEGGELEELEGFLDLDLGRPGGGPEEEAMPGAKAQQAKWRGGSVYWEGRIARGKWEEEGTQRESKR